MNRMLTWAFLGSAVLALLLPRTIGRKKRLCLVLCGVLLAQSMMSGVIAVMEGV